MATEPAATTRERLLQAALEVLAEKGFDRTRVAEIARRAGLTTGAIYANFGSRAELLAAAINEQQREVLDKALGPRGKGRVADRGVARAIAQTLAAPAADEHRRALDLFAAAARDDGVRSLLAEQASARAAGVQALLEAGVAKGQIDPALDQDAIGALVQLLGFGAIVSQGLGLGAPSASKLTALLERLLAPGP